jgi:hypothetical protein
MWPYGPIWWACAPLRILLPFQLFSWWFVVKSGVLAKHLFFSFKSLASNENKTAGKFKATTISRQITQITQIAHLTLIKSLLKSISKNISIVLWPKKLVVKEWISRMFSCFQPENVEIDLVFWSDSTHLCCSWKLAACKSCKSWNFLDVSAVKHTIPTLNSWVGY